LSSVALAELVHMKNGTTLRADSCKDNGDEFLCKRAGGVFGIGKSSVERIEKTSSRQSRNGRRSKPARIAPSRTAPPPEVEPESESVPAGGNSAIWQERLDQIDKSLARVTSGKDALLAEMAILYTLLGNDAFKHGDMDSAEASYMRAHDQNPSLAAPVLNLVRLRITQGRYYEAEHFARDGLAIDPLNPSALALMADVAYRQDRAWEAVELWEQSLAIKSNSRVRARLEKARREMEAEQDFYRSDATHFTLKYDGDKASQDLSDEILDHLEEDYGDLTSRFNVYPGSVIVVTLYSRKAFHDVTQSPNWVGGLFDGQIRIPIGGLTRLTTTARNVFTHELAHCMVFHKTHGTAPRWLQEGIAQWVEGKSARRHAGRLAQKHGGATPAQLAEAFSYPLSLSMIEHFLGVYTFSHLLDLLTALGEGSDMDSAFIRVTGAPHHDFLSTWLRARSGR
jgi:tetratricopeptide (TPR) repeat protein